MISTMKTMFQGWFRAVSTGVCPYHQKSDFLSMPESCLCRLEVVVTGTPDKSGGVQRRALFNCLAPWSHTAGLSVARWRV
jgi:hypothetical protein